MSRQILETPQPETPTDLHCYRSTETQYLPAGEGGEGRGLYPSLQDQYNKAKKMINRVDALSHSLVSSSNRQRVLTTSV